MIAVARSSMAIMIGLLICYPYIYLLTYNFFGFIIFVWLINLRLCLKIILPYVIMFVTRSLARLQIIELEEALKLIFSVKLGQIDHLLVLYELLEMSLQLTLGGDLQIELTTRLQQNIIVNLFLLLCPTPQIESRNAIWTTIHEEQSRY